MARRTWISVKRGLLEPKHRERIGAAIWVYMYILDRADWEQGAVLDWKDADAASELQMGLPTLRSHRRKLEDEGYIQTTQKQHGQKLAIMNYTNPREYSGKVYNAQGDTKTQPSEIEGDTQGYSQGVSKHVTPTSNSKVKSHNPNSPYRVKNQPPEEVPSWALNERLAQERNRALAEVGSSSSNVRE